MFRQSNDQTSKNDQIFKLGSKQSSKQGSTQIQSFEFKLPSPTKPTSTQIIRSDFVYKPIQTTTTKPPKPIIFPPLFGPVGRRPRNKGKNGPTALYNLNVNNIFASGFNINVGKNRVEF